MKYHLDFETYSEADIRKVGAFGYARHPSTQILCLAISREDREPLLWVPHIWDHLPFVDPIEQDEAWDMMMDLCEDEDAVVYAHNAPFEFAIWNNVRWAPPSQMLKKLKPEQMRCTAAMARRACIPHSLEKCASYLGLEQQKDNKGKSLIQKLSIPQKPDKTHPATWRRTPAMDPVRFKAMCEYCVQDVKVEMQIEKALHLFDSKGLPHDVFVHDLIINDRGFPVDVPALKRAEAMIDEVTGEAHEEFLQLTGFAPTQTKVLLPWLQEHGYKGVNLQAATMEEEMEDWEPDTEEGLDEVAKRALELRQTVSFAAVKKVKSMLLLADPEDSRVRGTLFYHGATTGRWASKLVQQQNLKRSTKDSEDAFAMLRSGARRDALELVHGPILQTIATCIRHFINDGEEPLDSVDYAAIEARIVCWLAGQEDALEEFRQGIDRYKIMAAKIFRTTVAHITKDQRFVGKQTVLGCIAEGQLVLTDWGEIPIEKVCGCHRVWDGEEWVQHEGVIYKGEQEVITYQGLTATPDHVVFVSDRVGLIRESHFGDASQQKASLVVSAEKGTPVRTLETYKPEEIQGAPLPPFCKSAVLGMQEYNDAGLSQHGVGQEQQMRSMRPPGQEVLHSPQVACEEDGSSKEQMHQSEESILSSLRGQGDTIQIPVCVPCCDVGSRTPRGGSIPGDRQKGQQRALRTRKLAMGYQKAAIKEHPDEQGRYGFCSAGVALLRADNHEVSPTRDEQKASLTPSKVSHQTEAQKVESNRQVVRVYDIVNAGPRHRFTVSGKLVHNCGYGMGANKFIGTCESYGQEVSAEVAELAVTTFRETHKEVVGLWYKLEGACKRAINSPGQKIKVGKHLTVFCMTTAGKRFLMIRLPSGRHLAYPEPRIESDRITFYGQVPGKAIWGRIETYSGKLVENCTQGVAADCMGVGTINATRAGHDIIMLVHDEAVRTTRGSAHTLEHFIKCLTDMPEWAAGLPLVAEGETIPWYRK